MARPPASQAQAWTTAAAGSLVTYPGPNQASRLLACRRRQHMPLQREVLFRLPCLPSPPLHASRCGMLNSRTSLLWTKAPFFTMPRRSHAGGPAWCPNKVGCSCLTEAWTQRKQQRPPWRRRLCRARSSASQSVHEHCMARAPSAQHTRSRCAPPSPARTLPRCWRRVGTAKTARELGAPLHCCVSSTLSLFWPAWQPGRRRRALHHPPPMQLSAAHPQPAAALACLPATQQLQ